MSADVAVGAVATVVTAASVDSAGVPLAIVVAPSPLAVAVAVGGCARGGIDGARPFLS